MESLPIIPTAAEYSIVYHNLVNKGSFFQERFWSLEISERKGLVGHMWREAAKATVGAREQKSKGQDMEDTPLTWQF